MTLAYVMHAQGRGAGATEFVPVAMLITAGINRALQRQYGLPPPVLPADVQRVGAAWRPWASVACWYLWRSLDNEPA